MENVPGHALNRPARSSVVLASGEAMSREAKRLMLHAVTIVTPPGGYSPSISEVGYALSNQLHVARGNFHVAPLKPGEFLADFKASPEHDRAFLKSFIEIGETVLPIRPWRPSGGPTETTWLFHAKITMENVPIEAWNEGVILILGDCYILDRLDSRTLARATLEFLTC